MAQSEFADHGVVEVLRAVDALGHPMAVPPVAELRHFDDGLADEFVEQGVVGVASGIQPAGRQRRPTA
ncbi:hypothetical protein SBI_00642 [Streptomyces bingchenggensis BCW-1]|uniref:Uncharacterized protein n=1 Tax=Streptomyces bingchenggensis (strain BCW-1) TaxID=749414 RepID=D7C2A9_STRBB|nr:MULTISPECIES: hypothetical protein [Streptomyces]ADI03763.1 hypothetical protein SBI_00642 [Streptomyces bingchenggensis BCW-1]